MWITSYIVTQGLAEYCRVKSDVGGVPTVTHNRKTAVYSVSCVYCVGAFFFSQSGFTVAGKAEQKLRNRILTCRLL